MVTVDAVMGSLKVAVIVEFTATPVAPLTGVAGVTVGGVVSAAAPVVNVQVRALVIALPATSLTPVVTLAVYWVEFASALDGVKVAVVPW